MKEIIQVAGVIDQAEAQMLIAEGVDWLGFPLRLPVNKEDLSEDEAATFIRQIRPPHHGVPITYLDAAVEIADFCAKLGARKVQLHGDISAAELRRLKVVDPDLFVVKSLVVHSDNADALAEMVHTMWEWVDMFITDSHDPKTGADGATGLVHDWCISRDLVQLSPRPVMLAGGLTPDNVAEAIRIVKPAAVDAHTGLEDSSGRKSPHLVREFVEKARQTFSQLEAA